MSKQKIRSVFLLYMFYLYNGQAGPSVPKRAEKGRDCDGIPRTEPFVDRILALWFVYHDHQLVSYERYAI